MTRCYVQKVVRRGNSGTVTLPRPVLFSLHLKPGDFVEVEEFEEGYLVIRPWRNEQNREVRPPGRVPLPMPELPR